MLTAECCVACRTLHPPAAGCLSCAAAASACRACVSIFAKSTVGSGGSQASWPPWTAHFNISWAFLLVAPMPAS